MHENNNIDLFSPEDGENEDDVIASDASALSGVVVSDADWTAETILNQLRKGNIQLNPRFQRRDAWDKVRKSRFIESLMLGLPIPQLVLAENQQNRGKYVVIDGKQRLLSLLKFAGDKDDRLKLSGLTLRPDLNGISFSDLCSDPVFADDLSAFENATVRTTVLRGWKNEEVLYLIFYRLNSGSVPLSPQELRHVLHPGAFIDFAFDFTEKSESFIKLFGKDGKPDFRMRDVEVLIRHIAFKEFGGNYQGDLKKFLDDATKTLNENWNHRELAIRNAAENCVNAINITNKIFDEDAFSKWATKGFENRFNRAVFDIMCYYFSETKIGDAAVREADLVKKSFIDLCINSNEFRKSLETTTKSVGATHTRFSVWGNKLETILGIHSDGLPKIPS